MNITISQLTAWHALIEQGSFVAASDALEKSENVLRTQVSDLGKAVNKISGRPTALHTSQRGEYVLTEHGRGFKNLIDPIVNGLANLNDDVYRLTSHSRSLHICASETLYEAEVFKLIARLKSKTEKPDDPIDLHIHKAGSGTSLQMLERGECHVAFVGDHFGTSRAIESQPFKRYPIGLILPDEAPWNTRTFKDKLRQNPTTGLQEVAAKYPFILPGRWSSFRQWADRFLIRGGIDHARIIEIDQGAAISAAISTGLGAAISWRPKALRQLAQGVVFTPFGKTHKRQIYMAWNQDRMNDTGRVFRDMVLKSVR